MSTVFGRSVPLEPEGPQALPGSYQVRLTADGKSYLEPFNLAMDPRVQATATDLEKQFTLEAKLAHALQQANQATREIHEARAAGVISEDAERKLSGSGGRRGEEEEAGLGGERHVSLTQLTGTLAQLLGVVDSADAAPTTQATRGADEALAQLQSVLAQWQKLKP
jgi:hypothetical protein